jgi:hypothetical protein
MSPVNGTVMRGWVEKPSSVLMTSMSWQSLTRTAQSGLGRLTRRKVALPKSTTVWRLLGKQAGGVVVAHRHGLCKRRGWQQRQGQACTPKDFFRPEGITGDTPVRCRLCCVCWRLSRTHPSSNPP